MARGTKLLVAVLAAVAVAASGLRRHADTCEPDEVAFAQLTAATCVVNWAFFNVPGAPANFTSPDRLANVGCWRLLGYNTDKFLSSTVYQNRQDGRCALAFSGYHGMLAGYLRGIGALVWPPQTWDMCGQKVYAPYARLMRHHTALANWSKLVHLMAGPESPCRGELTFTAESMGGSGGEMLAACASAGRLDELQDAKLPSFRFQTLFTFGAPASAVEPLVNHAREDGCFKGKRIFFAQDPVAHFGAFFGLKHPRMDAIEIWPGNATSNPSVKVYPCSSRESGEDAKHAQPSPVASDVRFDEGGLDKLQHEIYSYRSTLYWMNKAGKSSVFGAELMEDAPPSSSASRYLALLQSGAL